MRKYFKKNIQITFIINNFYDNTRKLPFKREKLECFSKSEVKMFDCVEEKILICDVSCEIDVAEEKRNIKAVSVSLKIKFSFSLKP